MSIGFSNILELISTESTSLSFTYVFLDVISFLPFLPSVITLDISSTESFEIFFVTVVKGISTIVVSIFSIFWFSLLYEDIILLLVFNVLFSVMFLFLSFFEIVIFRVLFSSKVFNSSSSKSTILFFFKISSGEEFLELINETVCLSMKVTVVCFNNVLFAYTKIEKLSINTNIIAKTIDFFIILFIFKFLPPNLKILYMCFRKKSKKVSKVFF